MRGVSVVMLNSFGFNPLGTSPLAFIAPLSATVLRLSFISASPPQLAGTRQHRREFCLYRKGRYYYFSVRSPGLRISRVHVMEVGRKVSLGNEVFAVDHLSRLPCLWVHFAARRGVGTTCTCTGVPLVTRFAEVRVHDRLEVWKGPKLPSRSGGEMATAAPCRCVRFSLYQTLSLGPSAATVSGAAGHNRRESCGDATPRKDT